MNEFITKELSEKKLGAFMRILKSCGLQKEEIFAVCTEMKSSQMMVDIVEHLEKQNFNLTPQETMNIIGQVIKENQ